MNQIWLKKSRYTVSRKYNNCLLFFFIIYLYLGDRKAVHILKKMMKISYNAYSGKKIVQQNSF